MSAQAFLAAARERYADANAATLRWMLDRPARLGRFLNTKQHPVTLTDYGPDDGHRAPGYIYGWIQGRGLESLVTHAAFFDRSDPALAAALDRAAAALYDALSALQARDGHAWFTYDAELSPVYPDAEGVIRPQVSPGDVYTYADTFVAKGLIAAAVRLGRTEGLGRHVAYFRQVVAAIEDGRFQIEERRPLSPAELERQPHDFGPRMIALGAAGMLRRLGLPDETAYADRFIGHILAHHYDAGSGLLANVPGEDACNVGHGIEFVGFALDHLPAGADPALVRRLESTLLASFRAGFVGPGIALAVSTRTGAVLNSLCPWWSLPETIRSAALCYERTRNPEALEVWERADRAFFELFWRGTPPVAFQTMTQEGPIDYVPATPDLDPGYPTGLSLLAAIHVADAPGERVQPVAASGAGG
jgi:hypothetical protein